jgi:hypothetical protein
MKIPCLRSKTPSDIACHLEHIHLIIFIAAKFLVQILLIEQKEGAADIAFFIYMIAR